MMWARRVLAVLLLMIAMAGGSSREVASAQQVPLLDINVATLSQIAGLPGMGPVYARRVVEGRPYTAKNQLVTRGILPQASYEKIRDRIVAHRATAVKSAPGRP